MNVIANIIEGVTTLADDLYTSDEERLKIRLAEKSLETQVIRGEQQIEQIRAQHPSWFVAGARLSLIWVGAIGLAYQFIAYPVILWLWAISAAQGWVPEGVTPPPPLAWEQLLTLVMGSGAVAGMRSYDKRRDKQTDRIR